MTPMLSVHQLLDEVRATERTVFETAQKHLRRLDGRISRQLTHMSNNTEHRYIREIRDLNFSGVILAPTAISPHRAVTPEVSGSSHIRWADRQPLSAG